jgi:hypothetical protein
METPLEKFYIYYLYVLNKPMQDNHNTTVMAVSTVFLRSYEYLS